MTAAFITCIKDESDVIFPNLMHHYNLGIRNFVVMFNNSNRATMREVARFHVIRQDIDINWIEDADIAYLQPERMTRMANFAYQRWGNDIWVVPVDADELVVTPNGMGLEECLPKDTEPGFIRCTWHDYIPPDLPKNQTELLITLLLPISSVFERWQDMCAKPRPQSKIIVKWQPGFRFGDGHHLLVTRTQEIPNPGIYYAHYPCRSKEFLRNKILTIGKAFIEKFGETSERPQVKQYHELISRGNEYFEQVWQNVQNRWEKAETVHRPAWRGKCT